MRIQGKICENLRVIKRLNTSSAESNLVRACSPITPTASLLVERTDAACEHRANCLSELDSESSISRQSAALRTSIGKYVRI